MKKKKNPRVTQRTALILVIVAIFIGTFALFYSKKMFVSGVTTLISFVLLYLILYFKKALKESSDIRKMEVAFPDFLQLMSTNLRAGMTTDKALLLSSRKEFAPLDKEILSLGKDIITGKRIEDSLKDMSQRINSKKIKKVITLIISGIKAGGNLAVLLEQTSRNMREREFVEKKASSNVLMYVIFIFFATSVGAPLLFSLSSVLVEILSSVLATVPSLDNSSVSLPFTLSSINVSISFILYFSVIFVVVLDILGSLVLGLVGKGEEREGVKYILPLITISLIVFFVIRRILLYYLSDFF